MTTSAIMSSICVCVCLRVCMYVLLWLVLFLYSLHLWGWYALCVQDEKGQTPLDVAGSQSAVGEVAKTIHHLLKGK